MSRSVTIVAIARADFLERVRRHRYLVTLGIAIYFAYLFLPPLNARYVTVQMGGHRGLYNSAWVGNAVAMLSTVFLSIAGFFLVRGVIERDRETGVGDILAATPLRKAHYTLAKMLSNFAVLATMVVAIALAAFVMQLVRGEDRHVDTIALFAPFAIVTLPTLAVVSAVAVLFETIGVLRGALGSAIYAAMWMTMVSLITVNASTFTTPFEPTGAGFVLADMLRSCERAFPDYLAARDKFSMGFTFKSAGMWSLKLFRWDGPRWTFAILGARAAWIALGLVIGAAAAIPFDRFDRGRGIATRARRRRRGAKVAADLEPAAEPSRDASPTRSAATLTPALRSYRFTAMLRAELKLMFKGVSRWWLLIASGLIIASALAPLEFARAHLLPFAWLWPVLFWSSMGTRETRYATAPILFSSPRPLARQWPATWLAGVALAVLTGGSIAVRLALAGEWASLGAWAVGALFIPSMALALGTASGSGKLFEALYVTLWYAGPLSGVPFLDFMGASRAAIPAGAPAIALVATLGLLAIAAFARSRAIKR